MSTTVTLSGALLDRLSRAAADRGVSLDELVEQLLHAGLDSEAEPFQVITFGAGGSGPLCNIDNASELIGSDDVARYGRDGEN